jgi:predicted alpha/beta-fold hydrolase
MRKIIAKLNLMRYNSKIKSMPKLDAVFYQTAMDLMSGGKTMKKNNTHTGSRFDDFLKEQGLYEEVVAKALKRVIAEQLKESMEEQHITKVAMAARMATSRTQIDRLLDPNNLRIQFDSLVRAASAVGKRVEIRLVNDAAASG